MMQQGLKPPPSLRMPIKAPTISPPKPIQHLLWPVRRNGDQGMQMTSNDIGSEVHWVLMI